MVNEYRHNVPLAPFTTFGVGGAAQLFWEAKSEPEILRVFEDNHSDEVFVLGGGSNVLISDNGFDGVVLRMATKGIKTNEPVNGIVMVTAEAGEDWDEFVAFCVERDLAGIECLSGIPGLVGGTPIQNVGAYGQEVSETIKEVRVLERATSKILTIDAAECNFEYRKSIFNSVQKNRYVVLSVTFALTLGGSPKLGYADLKGLLSDPDPDLKSVRQGVMQIRKSKGMLVRQGGIDSNSAGSFFKNPVVTSAELEAIANNSVDLGITEFPEQMPRFKSGDDAFKIPAAWLIEKSGFPKGFVFGNAGISSKHSLALINRGGATAKELIELKALIQRTINKMFGLQLDPEPNFVGFSNAEENEDV